MIGETQKKTTESGSLEITSPFPGRKQGEQTHSVVRK